MRNVGYRKCGAARAAHWLLLIAADRVDALESQLASLLSARPESPLTEAGIKSDARLDGSHSCWHAVGFVRVGRGIDRLKTVAPAGQRRIQSRTFLVVRPA